MDEHKNKWHLRSAKGRKQYLDSLKSLYSGQDSTQETIYPIVTPKVRGNDKVRPKVTESSIQMALVEWAHIHDLPLIAIPNHGKRSRYEGHKQVLMGLRAGVSDLFLARPCNGYAGFWIELKSPGKKPSVDQINWLIRMQSECYKSEWYDNLDEAIQGIKDYLNLA